MDANFTYQISAVFALVLNHFARSVQLMCLNLTSSESRYCLLRALQTMNMVRSATFHWAHQKTASEQYLNVVCCLYGPLQHSNYVYMLNASLTLVESQHASVPGTSFSLCCSHTLHCNLNHLIQLGHL